MKIIVTGALGHIGSKVIREIPIYFPNCRIIMMDNMLTQRYSSLFDLPTEGSYQFIEADITQFDLQPIFKNADVVIHLAAITDATSSFKNKEKIEQNNYQTTVRVAKMCSSEGVPLIHLSSTSVYGTQRDVVDENCTPEELSPQSPYAETKIKEEEYLKNFGKIAGLKFITCRFGTICGISKGMRFHTAVNKFCWQAVLGQPLTVWATALHQKRPYLDLEDALQAFVHIIKKKIYTNEIYNVLTNNLTVNDIISLIKDHIPNLKIKFVDEEIMNQLSYEVLDYKFANTGFSSMGSIKKGIYETIQLIKQCYKIS